MVFRMPCRRQVSLSAKYPVGYRSPLIIFWFSLLTKTGACFKLIKIYTTTLIFKVYYTFHVYTRTPQYAPRLSLVWFKFLVPITMNKIDWSTLCLKYKSTVEIFWIFFLFTLVKLSMHFFFSKKWPLKM